MFEMFTFYLKYNAPFTHSKLEKKYNVQKGGSNLYQQKCHCTPKKVKGQKKAP